MLNIMVTSNLIMRGRNSKGSWRLVAVCYNSGHSYYVNHFPPNGNLNSFRFNSFKEAYEFFKSQKVKQVNNG
jgi:hypothetical protein